VLVIDDERSLFSVYEELFASEGWSCECWRGPGTVQQVADLGPSLILTDLVFAGDRQAGLRFVTALANSPATASIPVIVCSADVRQLEDSTLQSLASTCCQLAKPFDIEVLVTEIQRCLQWQPVQIAQCKPHFH
jgi:CheY-like chemotaxis protein